MHLWDYQITKISQHSPMIYGATSGIVLPSVHPNLMMGYLISNVTFPVKWINFEN